MRKNYPTNSSIRYRNWDRVYVDLPQCPGYSKLVCEPLKTVYINRAADPMLAVPRMFRSIDDLENFCAEYRIWVI